MPTYSSPGNYVLEKDFSEYAPSVNSSIAGVVGFASKGPPDKATLITSPSQLIRTFGKSSDVEGGQGILGATEILSKTNSIYYVRAEDYTTSQEAEVGVFWGSCPAMVIENLPKNSQLALYISTTDSEGNNNTPGTDDTFRLTLGNTGGNPATALIAANSAVQTADSSFTILPYTGNDFSDPETSPVTIVGSSPGEKSTLTVSAVVDITSNDELILNHFDYQGNLTPSSTTRPETYLSLNGMTAKPTTNGGIYMIKSLYSGTGYNSEILNTAQGVTNKGIKIQIAPTPEESIYINVIDEGVLSEGYTASFADRGLFIEDVINTGNIDPVSEFIKGSFQSLGGADKTWNPPNTWGSKLPATAEGVQMTQNGTDYPDTLDVLDQATPRYLKLATGEYDLEGGKNGDIVEGDVTAEVAAALIGEPAYKSGIYALDDDSLNLSMACVPGLTHEVVQNTLITLAETSQNFLAVVSPPANLNTAQDAINWHNGNYTGRSSAINSSYAAIYWPWLKTFDVGTATDVYMDPAVYAISIMCHTDSVSDPWFAPAGLIRGRLTKPTDVEVILNQGDRDSLYQPGNSINPIAKFAQDGIVIWGQKTAQRTPSALDRVNVRRMMIVIRKMILAATRSIVFEPNDPMTWNRVVDLLQPAMDDIRRRRGITEFRVVCDETTNTPLRIDRNEMWCRVLIKPTKTAEILVFELNLTGQSASLGV